MTNKFNIGDIVCLHSGSRKMQISAICGNNITCKYLVKNKKAKEVTLSSNMLKKDERDNFIQINNR